MSAIATLPDVLSKAKDAILAIDPDAEVILFGSRARGDHRPDSDWDLLVVTERHEDREFKTKITNQLYDLMLETGELFFPLFFQKRKWHEGATPSPLITNIRREGQAI